MVARIKKAAAKSSGEPQQDAPQPYRENSRPRIRTGRSASRPGGGFLMSERKPDESSLDVYSCDSVVSSWREQPTNDPGSFDPSAGRPRTSGHGTICVIIGRHRACAGAPYGIRQPATPRPIAHRWFARLSGQTIREGAPIRSDGDIANLDLLLL